MSRRWESGLLFILGLVGAFFMLDSGVLALTQPAAGSPVEYRDVPLIGSRNLIWLSAQVHLIWGGFVLGVPVFAWICEIIGVTSKDEKYIKLSREFTNLLTAAFEMTAMLGAIFLFLLMVLYPKVVNFIAAIFWPTFYVYVGLFAVTTTTLYLYWSGFETMKRHKGLHLFLGFLLNLFAVAIMVVPNAWATFQASPVVLAEGMSAWEKAWTAMSNPTWIPVNVHRFIANIVLGGFICGAYAGIRYLGAKTQEEREHYDWMGYIGNFVGIFGLLPLPFAGYWLMREIYMYNQQMGITLMGGFLSWLFILQAVLIGALFLGANYYFWLGLAYRTEGGVRYRKAILGILVVLLTCFGIWLTPHSLVATIQEARAMGGAHHPILGVFGVMSAKMTVVNIMILFTFISFIMYWRAGKQETVAWAKAAKAFIVFLFVVAILGVITLGVWGYFVPAIVRINKFSVWQVLLVLFVLVTITPLVGAMLRSAKLTSRMTWGKMPVRAQYALVVNAVTVVLTMTLMGYARSASRGPWHVYGVLEDTSPYAYSPALGHAGAFMSLSTFLVCGLAVFLFWAMHRTVRYPAFSTQYFFIAPFVLWVFSLPEKALDRLQTISRREKAVLAESLPVRQVSEQPNRFPKAVAIACGFLIVFTYISYSVPQKVSLPPKKQEFDPSQIKTQAEIVKAGQMIFFGKGQCALCHTLEASESARAPNLQGVGAKLTREFIYESLTQPQAFIYMDYSASPPRPFPAKMPVINKPPVGLSEPELLAVIAFLQSLGGDVTVQPEEVKAFMPATAERGILHGN
ncbi:MAG: cytochrome ubiquinol oxidase subunit I [Nitrospirae bacterium]|nr:cytochrome ubiquinol oxidase subunit I [Nitrospirota bacterium]